MYAQSSVRIASASASGSRVWVSIQASIDMFFIAYKDQSRNNGPINAHLTIAKVMPRYNHNNEKQEALL